MELDTKLVDMLHDEGYFLVRYIDGKGYCGIRNFLFTFGLCIGLDATGLAGRYCYSNLAEAQIALLAWDGTGDPKLNWIKYKGRGGERSNVNHPNYVNYDEANKADTEIN